jgi:predicted  nucleic acid-binding Zn-ribbon protein
MKTDCNYYDRAVKTEGCPFSFSCKEGCFFVYKGSSEAYDDLYEEYKAMENTLSSLETEMNDLEGNITDLENEIATVENQNDDLIDFIKVLLKCLKSYKSGEELKELIEGQSNLSWSTTEELCKGIVE